MSIRCELLPADGPLWPVRGHGCSIWFDGCGLLVPQIRLWVFGHSCATRAARGPIPSRGGLGRTIRAAKREPSDRRHIAERT